MANIRQERGCGCEGDGRRDHDGPERLGDSQLKVGTTISLAGRPWAKRGWLSPTRVGALSSPPITFHCIWKRRNCALQPRPSATCAPPMGAHLSHSPSCLPRCLAASRGTQGPKERAVLPQARSPGYAELRLLSHTELARLRSSSGSTEEGSLASRAELMPGEVPGDYPAWRSRPQLHTGGTEKVLSGSNVQQC